MAELRFEQVSHGYPGSERLALDRCSVTIPSGKRVAIIGRNGSGKSTLFLHCNAILKPSDGQIFVDSVPMAYGRAAIKALRQRVGIVFQSADDQLFSASIEQDISFGPLNMGLSETEVRARIADVASQCELTHLLGKPIHALSGGEKARVALAGVLAMRPEVILVDEPTASLDPLIRRQVFKIFNALHADGKTVVVATHEYEVARYWADFVIVMDAGQVLLADVSANVFAQNDILSGIGLNAPWYEDVFDTKPHNLS